MPKNDFCYDERYGRCSQNHCIDENIPRKAPSVFAGIPVVQTEDFKELTRVGLDGHMQK